MSKKPQKIIIPRGLININENTVVEIPEALRENEVIIVKPTVDQENLKECENERNSIRQDYFIKKPTNLNNQYAQTECFNSTPAVKEIPYLRLPKPFTFSRTTPKFYSSALDPFPKPQRERSYYDSYDDESLRYRSRKQYENDSTSTGGNHYPHSSYQNRKSENWKSYNPNDTQDLNGVISEIEFILKGNYQKETQFSYYFYPI